jgi:hypothetical protein
VRARVLVAAHDAASRSVAPPVEASSTHPSSLHCCRLLTPRPGRSLRSVSFSIDLPGRSVGWSVCRSARQSTVHDDGVRPEARAPRTRARISPCTRTHTGTRSRAAPWTHSRRRPAGPVRAPARERAGNQLSLLFPATTRRGAQARSPG